METTNIHNLPETIYNSIIGMAYKPKENRYSVTDLIAPPQMRKLKIKFWDELQEDASDRLWALLGNAVHYVLEKGSPQDAETEKKLEITFEETTISGKADLLHNSTLVDYKITSVWSFLLGDKPEWEKQMNMYAYMLSVSSHSVKNLQIHAILRDWKKSEALRDERYPRIPFQTVSVPLWTTEEQEGYIRARLKAHKAENTPCSDEERWMKPTTWAVMKAKNKRAFRVLENKAEAEKLAATDKAFSVVERKGQYNRCFLYCSVRDFCPQLKAEEQCEEEL